jgi:hypothetical protein
VSLPPVTGTVTCLTTGKESGFCDCEIHRALDRARPLPHDIERAVGQFGIDESIAPFVDALNAAGIKTVASCSGHGQIPGSVALRDGRFLLLVDGFDDYDRIIELWGRDIHGTALPPGWAAERKLQRAADEAAAKDRA